MDDSVIGTWRGRAGSAYPVELEVEFRHDGTYRATTLQLWGADTTRGRYTVSAGSPTTIEFVYVTSGHSAPLTERLTMEREDHRLLLRDQAEDMVLTKNDEASTTAEG